MSLFPPPPQVWSQWEEDSAWSDSLLRTLQASFPKMHQEEEDSEEEITENLSVCRVRDGFRLMGGGGDAPDLIG